MTQTNTQYTTIIITAVALMISLFAIALLPASAAAATYAYVDVAGTVRSVTADNWQTAIATAPNIHVHSGVMILDSANDLLIVGNKI